MAYHSTPHSTTGYSFFFLLHGRKMVTPANENLRAKVPKPTQGPEQQIENLTFRLRQSHKSVAKANIKSHSSNKQRYDRHRNFAISKSDTISIFTTQLESPNCQKVSFFMDEPISSKAKLSELNIINNH
jgi:hypothetical protein